MDQIIRYLRNSNHILVATHTHPDGDAIGSLIAMGLCLEGLNKKITLYNESPIPAVYRSNGSVDVAAIAASFGGGGHSSAAGFSIESTLSDIKLQLLNMADTI